MSIIICPGIHESVLTECFLSGCMERVRDEAKNRNEVDLLIFPGESGLALSAFHILQFLHKHLQDRIESPVVFISFSAGVVGAILAAHKWQQIGGYVKAFIAIDGWGVPVWGNFPIHRMSHDYFTHWSSSVLGSGENNFYADPAVEHHQMWRSPQTVQGYWVNSSLGESLPKERLSAAEFLQLLLRRYEDN
ncbi:hypothetical protein [Brasilonema sp. UFV-L1]|uniref:hypothetical protein n=1 Tax=Brasilonema sp. UFV-L1 TaxID=2234130 RepID=UPI00145EDB24|nr:hypothetical protein [Brasilonema sp. UFV-L1]NMG09831.1 hypothetical protein [Brasilonema sp. UFV-L1]